MPWRSSQLRPGERRDQASTRNLVSLAANSNPEDVASFLDALRREWLPAGVEWLAEDF
jgi:hypothetical protein